jgi:flagellin
MVVQHNMTAANANRQLGVTTSAQAKATEKLSSGYKINRAADDAAGLTISEKMRSQIRSYSGFKERTGWYFSSSDS